MPLKNKLLLTFLLLMLWSSSGIAKEMKAFALPSTQELNALEADAATPEEHARLAAYYRDEARKLDNKVRYHDEMGQMYRKNPLPFDGKTAVPMGRHCREWARHFNDEAERAAVLAAFHEQKSVGSGSNVLDLSHPNSWGLRNRSFSSRGSIIQPTQEQNSLFRDSMAALIRFHDLSKVLTYILSANNRPTVQIVKLRKSAATMFDYQRQFVGSLTETQKAAVDAHLVAAVKLRQKMENALNALEAMEATLSSKSSFRAANKLKGALESWNNEQRAIAVQLQIEN